MKHLNHYITEKLKINSNTKISKYSCQPKSQHELMKIVSQRIGEDKNANLNDIDVSLITNFSNIFEGLDPGKIDISEWNVTNATLMIEMFNECHHLECDISNWDVSNVVSFAGMFRHCDLFKSDLSKWNVSRCSNMRKMFNGCLSFDSDLSKWDVSRVVNMTEMFYNCKTFNCDLSNWDVYSVTGLDYAFYNCSRLTSTDFNKWTFRYEPRSLHTFRNCIHLKKPVWYNETSK